MKTRHVVLIGGICLVAAICYVAGWLMQPGPAPQLDIVVPDNWRGVVLFQHPSGARSATRPHKRLTIIVPESGIVSDPQLAEIYDRGYHVSSVQTFSGTKVPLLMDEREFDNVIAWRDTLRESVEGIWIVVGDRADWERFFVTRPSVAGRKRK